RVGRGGGVVLGFTVQGRFWVLGVWSEASVQVQAGECGFGGSLFPTAQVGEFGRGEVGTGGGGVRSGQRGQFFGQLCPAVGEDEQGWQTEDRCEKQRGQEHRGVGLQHVSPPRSCGEVPVNDEDPPRAPLTCCLG